MAKTRSRTKHRKHRRGGGMFDSVSAFFGMKPKEPTEAVAAATETTAKEVGLEPTTAPEGLPGGQTPPEQASLGGRRRRTRKHKKSRRRR
jgi:hypothetical protein